MKVFISDLHLGCGDSLDDFYYSPSAPSGTSHVPRGRRRSIRRMHTVFRFFLRRILHQAREQGTKPELVLLGDVFDLLQVRGPRFCSPRKIDSIHRAHAPFFDALNRFARAGASITYVIGNHDHEAFDPAVFRALRHYVPTLNQSHGAQPLPYYACDDAGIYAEHGNQIDPFNQYRDFADPTEIPLGSDVVLSIVNRYEERYPLIDNIQGTSETLLYALRHLPGFVSKELRASLESVRVGASAEIAEIAQHIFYALRRKRRLPGNAKDQHDWVRIFLTNEEALRRSRAANTAPKELLLTFARLSRHPFRILREQDERAFLQAATAILNGRRRSVLGSLPSRLRIVSWDTRTCRAPAPLGTGRPISIRAAGDRSLSRRAEADFA